MKVRNVDWSCLRGTLRWVVAAGLCCAVMLGLSSYYLGEQRRAFDRQSNERDSVREDYLAAETQARMLGEYYIRYRALQHQGVVGAEHRLDWVEAVQESARRLKLPKIQYQIMPREPFSLPSLPSYPGLLVYASKMKLDMELMHEGDLAMVIDKLERAAPGAVHVQTCGIRRLQDTLELKAVTPNLTASCELLWFTIGPESAAPAGGA